MSHSREITTLRTSHFLRFHSRYPPCVWPWKQWYVSSYSTCNVWQPATAELNQQNQWALCLPPTRRETGKVPFQPSVSYDSKHNVGVKTVFVSMTWHSQWPNGKWSGDCGPYRCRWQRCVCEISDEVTVAELLVPRQTNSESKEDDSQDALPVTSQCNLQLLGKLKAYVPVEALCKPSGQARERGEQAVASEQGKWGGGVSASPTLCRPAGSGTYYPIWDSTLVHPLPLLV